MLHTSSLNSNRPSKFIAALDSACTSHTVKRSSLPKKQVMDSLRVTHIQTASSGATMPSFGKASNGVMEDAFVVEDNKLAKNLVSIPKLDRAG